MNGPALSVVPLDASIIMADASDRQLKYAVCVLCTQRECSKNDGHITVGNNSPTWVWLAIYKISCQYGMVLL